MLVDVSLGRPPRLNVARQHRVLHQASERLWESIPRTVPNGRDVQALVREIVAISRVENAKPRMPYPPGVTGTALLMGERKLLLDEDYRKKTPGAERLFGARADAGEFGQAGRNFGNVPSHGVERDVEHLAPGVVVFARLPEVAADF